ncbi:NAD(P)H-dependent oxidoreductase [Streptomyces caniscabiei]|uniref:NAD(P)H-dependent oxidoreductase n=1 Tax=Streptomyces caniscabiei TaxID=2746961 RepID=A0A927L5G2_9ACTN|nr:NAD(P)H-dependent oxidoreductase [Streptomyces caniscabiei]MBD9725905.1 NAD(P)H-dependent oxidoreductase [Streptomyces caniscabiei]MDX3507623.1 NAD(P)H-dependent oxidoreductase [Streptomyces caniscabiei]MDX3717585.1 NAD(P)H-dependent oxidoreductase [Streptomyces caniscabiei]WEO25337.1 NAD(P)H-dependent oxidoreductase [Streptomyces caniscabiei]
MAESILTRDPVKSGMNAATSVLSNDCVRSFAFMLGGSRAGSATESLARRAAGGLPAAVERSWLCLNKLSFPAQAVPGTKAAEERLLGATLDHTDIVVVSPLYWYSVSAQTKLYLDYWAFWMARPGLDFRARMGGKTLWAVSTFARGEVRDAQPLVGMLERTAQYLGMAWGGALLCRARSTGQLADHNAGGDAAAFFAAAARHPEPGLS